jgi:hypothetical protein
MWSIKIWKQSDHNKTQNKKKTFPKIYTQLFSAQFFCLITHFIGNVQMSYDGVVSQDLLKNDTV